MEEQVNKLQMYLLSLLYTGLKAVLKYKIVPKDRNIRDHLAWPIGKGDPMHEICIPHRERGSHARDLHPTQDTSRTGQTTWLKQKEDQSNGKRRREGRKEGRKEGTWK